MLTRKYLKTIIVNLGVNYSYLAIQLERSASFASLIRLYVNSRDVFCLGWKNALGALATPNKKILPKATTKILLASFSLWVSATFCPFMPE